MAIANGNAKEVFEDPEKRLKILHMVLAIGYTNCAYMELSLPQTNRYDITICTFFKSKVTPPSEISFEYGH